MLTEKLFTVLLGFSDHASGIGQYKAESPERALEQFIKSSESLEDYDRGLLQKSILPLIHLANEKGVWLFTFDPDLTEIEWPGDNPVLGGQIIQTDTDATTR